MAVTEDASQPASVNTDTGTTITTAAFSPPANTLLLAVIASNGVAGTATTCTVSDSGSHTWTLYKRQNTNTASAGGSCEVWGCYTSSALSGITVNAHQTAGTANGILLSVKVLNGASSTQPGAVAGKESDSSAPTQSLTTTQTGSYVYGSLADFSGTATFTANSSTTIMTQHSDTTNNNTYVTCKASASTGTPGATTYGFTAPATCAYNFALVEVLPGGGNIVPDVVVLQSVKRASFY